MNNFRYLNLIVTLGLFSLSHPCWSKQNQDIEQTFVERGPQMMLLSIAVANSSIITPDEILQTSRDYRFEGFVIEETLNEQADIADLNNMERLEFLKYTLDAGFVPLPPHLDLPNYFKGQKNNQPFPNIEDIIRLQEICFTRFSSINITIRGQFTLPFCDPSPLSFIRLALFTTPDLRESGQTVFNHTYLETLLQPFGYHLEDLTPNDLEILKQFLGDLGYVLATWPELSVQVRNYKRRHIQNVTDDNFQTEVIEASREKPILVYFHASWCPPCHTMTPLIEELAIEFEGAFTLAKVYSSGNPTTAGILNQNVIPSLILYRNGQQISQRVGGIRQTSNFLLGDLPFPLALIPMKDDLKEILREEFGIEPY